MLPRLANVIPPAAVLNEYLKKSLLSINLDSSLLESKSGITNLRYTIPMIINVVNVIARNNDNNC